MSVVSELIKTVLEHVAENAAEKKAAGPIAKQAEKRVAAPAVIQNRAGTPAANAQDILTEAARKKKASETYAAWKAAYPEAGKLLDTHRLHQVPDVPQHQMPRVVPPRGPSARMVDALSNPDVVKGLNETVERGAQGGGLEWYNTDPLRERMPRDDPNAYSRLMDLVAATSPRSRVADNIRTASYYNYLLANGLPIPDSPMAGYGSVAQKLHTQNVRGVEGLGGWDVFRNPKPASFSSNLQGNQQNVTIDTHNMRLPALLSQDPRFLMGSMVAEKGGAPVNPAQMYKRGEITLGEASKQPTYWATKPQPNEYGYYEKWQQDQARKMGMSPAQYQASMWLGGGEDTGLGSTAEPFLHTLESRVRYTADRMGLDPDAVLEQMLAGKIPLLAKGGEVDVDALRTKYGC